jgi:hypothetical protein
VSPALAPTSPATDALGAARAVEEIVLAGRGLSAEVRKALTDAEVEETMEGASTLTLPLLDPADDLLRSGLFESRVRAEVRGLPFQFVKVASRPPLMIPTFEDLAVALLRERDDPLAATRGATTRAEFFLRLVREVTELRIGFYAPELHRTQRIGAAPAEAEAAANAPPRPRSSGSERVTVKGRRADAEQRRNMQVVLGVCNRLNAGAKATKAVVLACIVESLFRNLRGGDATSSGILQVLASTGRGVGVDPRDVEAVVEEFLTDGFWRHRPRGAIELARQNPSWSAARIAQECQGSAHPGRYAQWSAEADRIIDAFGGSSAAPTGPASDPGQSSRFQFRRGEPGKPEDSWTAMGRLAKEVEWRRFMRRGVLWYVSDEWLLRRPPRLVLSRTSDGVQKIEFETDAGLPTSAASLTMLAAEWAALPGDRVDLKDLGLGSGKYLVATARRRLFSPVVTAELVRGTPPLPEPAAQSSGGAAGGTVQGGGGVTVEVPGGQVTTRGGAKGIVDQAFAVAREAGGESVYVGSSLRRGDTVESGGLSDHAEDNAGRAARDIGKRGVNLISGPPSRELDRAVVAIGRQFGRDYGDGARVIIDTFPWRGFRVQIIWRTPRYGGHRGHIHIGVRRQ